MSEGSLKTQLERASRQIKHLKTEHKINGIAWLLDQSLSNHHSPWSKGAKNAKSIFEWSKGKQNGKNILQFQKDLVFILGHLVNDIGASNNSNSYLPYYLETFTGSKAL